MSYYEEVHERIRIRNNCAAGKAMIGHLREYIQQFNHMAAMESLRLILVLSDGEDEVRVEEKGSLWRKTPEGTWQDTENYGFWLDEHPLMQMLERLDSHPEITCEVYADYMKHYGADYGSNYWQKLIEATEPADCVDYRVLSIDDFEPYAYLWCNRSPEPKVTSLDAVADIPKWYGYNFAVEISGVKRSDWQAFAEQLDPMADAFLLRFGKEPEMLSEEDIIEIRKYCMEAYGTIPDPLPRYAFEGEAEFVSGPIIGIERVPEFVESLQAFVDIAARFDAKIELGFDYTPCGEYENNFAPFAAISFNVVDGKVVAEPRRCDPDAGEGK